MTQVNKWLNTIADYKLKNPLEFISNEINISEKVSASLLNVITIQNKKFTIELSENQIRIECIKDKFTIVGKIGYTNYLYWTIMKDNHLTNRDIEMPKRPEEYYPKSLSVCINMLLKFGIVYEAYPDTQMFMFLRAV